jgi:hypothetical protein
MTASINPTSAARQSASSSTHRFFRVACWIPVLTFITVVGFAAIAANRMRHWPYYSNPDPKDLHLPFLHGAALLSYPLALLSIPIGLFVAIFGWSSLRRRDVIMFTAGTAAWAFILPITGRLFEWLID